MKMHLEQIQGKVESDENGRGAADIRPQPDADLEDAMDESPKKRSRIEMEEVKDDDQEDQPWNETEGN